MAKPLQCVFMTISGPKGSRHLVVDQGSFVVGRSFDALVMLAESNVSRQHLLIKNKKGNIYVEDLGSANGTFLNGQRLKPRTLTRIAEGDRLLLGNSGVELRLSTVEMPLSADGIRFSRLSPEEQDGLLNLIEGAQAEAERCLALGQSTQAEIIQAGEAKARSIEAKAISDAEQIADHARQESARLVQRAKEEAEQAVRHIHEQARETVAAAERQAAAMLKRAQEESLALRSAGQAEFDAQSKRALGILEQAEKDARAVRERASQSLDEAHRRAKEIMGDAERQAGDIREKSRAAEKEILSWADKRAQEIIQFAQLEGAKKVEALLKIAEAECKALREVTLEEAKNQAIRDRDLLFAEGQGRLSAIRSEIAELEIERERVLADIGAHERIVLEKRKSIEDEIARMQQRAEAEASELAAQVREGIQKERERLEREVARRKALVEDELNFLKEKSTEELKQLDEQRRELERILNQLKLEVTELGGVRDELKVLAEQRQKELFEIKGLQDQRQQLESEKQSLQAERGQLAMQLETERRNLEIAKQEVVSESLKMRDKLNGELEEVRRQHQAEIEDSKRRHILEVQNLKAQFHGSLIESREDLARRFVENCENLVLRHMTPEQWRTLKSELGPISVRVVDDTLGAMSTTNEAAAVQVSLRSQKLRRLRLNATLQGVIMGVLLSAAGLWGYRIYKSDLDPVRTSARERAKAIQEDLERRKFAPPQDDELRDTYRDSVLYTRDYVAHYLSEEFQKKWLKSASDYLLKEWRVQEETTVEVLAILNTLVLTLKDQKEAIHPDFVKLGLQKMADSEAEAVDRVEKLLGSPVRWEALKRHERRFYETFRSEQIRQPASPKRDP